MQSFHLITCRETPQKMGKSAWAPYSNNQSKQVSEIDQKLHLFEYSIAQKHPLCQKRIFPSVLDYN